MGRKYVRPADICFYDTVEYDPDKLRAPPYRLDVTSELPLLGDKARRAPCCQLPHAQSRACRTAPGAATLPSSAHLVPNCPLWPPQPAVLSTGACMCMEENQDMTGTRDMRACGGCPDAWHTHNRD